MANLIITIISIALVAVAALMGAYYGGTAFLEGQAKAYANASASQGEQQVAAWSIYAADRGGVWNLTSLAVLSSTTPAYLSSLPSAPGGVVTSLSTGISAWTLVDLSAAPGAATDPYDAVYYQLADNSAGVATCNLIAQMIGGTSAAPSSAAASTDILINTARKFDCVYVGSALTAASTVPKYIYYRAF